MSEILTRMNELVAAFDERDWQYAPCADGTAAYFELRGIRETVIVDCDEAAEAWSVAFGYSYQEFEWGAEDEMLTVLAEIFAGNIMSFSIEVGDQREVCGWCEREYVADILRDYRDDPMTLGGVLCVRAFDAESAEEYPLSEAAHD